MNLKKLQQEIHGNNIKAGWYDDPRRPLEYHALFTSEVAEATECVRNNMKHGICFWDTFGHDWEVVKNPIEHAAAGNKPEGEGTELADVIIRILDYAEHRAWNMDDIVRAKIEYNKTRGYKHGGKAL